jgi:rRNA maturation endonuclease Nob1
MNNMNSIEYWDKVCDMIADVLKPHAKLCPICGSDYLRGELGLYHHLKEFEEPGEYRCGDCGHEFIVRYSEKYNEFIVLGY